jgi:hypothetical protein
MSVLQPTLHPFGRVCSIAVCAALYVYFVQHFIHWSALPLNMFILLYSIDCDAPNHVWSTAACCPSRHLALLPTALKIF